MAKRILIIGGYGNFGHFIAKMLAREADIQIIIAGRDLSKAKALVSHLESANKPEAACIDIHNNLSDALKDIAPDIVIHTSGPYQSQGYGVASACINQKCHYIDLADAREFVNNIHTLDQNAKDNNVFICSGASSVPTLTSAIIDKYITTFKVLENVEYGIATAQRTNRGLATTEAVLSYAGKPFKTLINGEMKDVYGWLSLRFRSFWGMNNRSMGNCDIPDLELFPKRYPSLKNIRFQAGLELKFLHFILVIMSWLVRVKLLPPLQLLAPYLLKISRIFDWIGNDDSGFYMELSGTDDSGEYKKTLFEIVARESDGLYIPSIPSILMAIKLARGEIKNTGATPCMGFITLDEYLNALKEFKLQWRYKTLI